MDNVAARSIQAGGTPAAVMAPPLDALATDTLCAVQQTLLIPLVARAFGGALYPGHACADRYAQELVQRLTLDPQYYLGDRPTVLNVLWRTRLICDAARAFFAAHPTAWGLNLGCGLSHYFQWLDNGQNHWLDADLPAVMGLRERLLPAPQGRLHATCADLENPHWWQCLRLPPSALEQPIFIVCEGVLMYLQPAQVRQVLQQFADVAPPGSVLVLDTLARSAVGQAQWHASVGRTEAQFHWGIAQWQELTACHPRLHLHNTHSVAPSHGWMGMTMEAMCNPWGLGAPLYGLAELQVQ